MSDSPLPRTISELLGATPPSNWGKWGPDDEVGSLNYLTPDVILKDDLIEFRYIGMKDRPFE